MNALSTMSISLYSFINLGKLCVFCNKKMNPGMYNEYEHFTIKSEYILFDICFGEADKFGKSDRAEIILNTIDASFIIKPYMVSLQYDDIINLANFYARSVEVSFTLTCNNRNCKSKYRICSDSYSINDRTNFLRIFNETFFIDEVYVINHIADNVSYIHKNSLNAEIEHKLLDTSKGKDYLINRVKTILTFH